MTSYRLSRKRFLKIVSLTLLIFTCLCSLYIVSAEAEGGFVLKIFNDVGEPIHLRSAKIDGYWVDIPKEKIVFPPATIQEGKMVQLKGFAHEKSFSIFPSGSLIYEAANYGRTSGRVEIKFRWKQNGSIAECVPTQRCKISHSIDNNYNLIAEIHVL